MFIFGLNENEYKKEYNVKNRIDPDSRALNGAKNISVLESGVLTFH